MLEMFLKMQNKRRAKGGFTLVELIVVLVILAILAALLIPALTGYIDKAKEKSIVAETRSVVMAAQTLADEVYGKRDLGGSTSISFAAKPTTGTTGPDVTFEDVAALAEIKNVENINSITATAGKISEVIYKRDGRTCTYNGTSYDVTKP